MKRQFAIDNYAGICPEAWHSLCEVNQGHALPYGEDESTERACGALLKGHNTR
jgi:threonine aldolase